MQHKFAKKPSIAGVKDEKRHGSIGELSQLSSNSQFKAPAEIMRKKRPSTREQMSSSMASQPKRDPVIALEDISLAMDNAKELDSEHH